LYRPAVTLRSLPKLAGAGFVVLAVEKVLEGLDVGEGAAAAFGYVLALLLLALGSVFVARARRTPLAWLAAALFAVSLAAGVFATLVDLSVGFYVPTRRSSSHGTRCRSPLPPRSAR
jgi:Na+/H+ antiporter NhaA